MFAYNALIAAKEGNLWSTWNLFMFMIFINRIETRARDEEVVGAADGHAHGAGGVVEIERHDARRRLVAATVALVAFSRYNGTMDGNVFVFFILTVAAAEVAVGLAIIVALFRRRQTIQVEELNALKN
jgi:hypothetical protein